MKITIKYALARANIGIYLLNLNKYINTETAHIQMAKWIPGGELNKSKSLARVRSNSDVNLKHDLTSGMYIFHFNKQTLAFQHTAGM